MLNTSCQKPLNWKIPMLPAWQRREEQEPLTSAWLIRNCMLVVSTYLMANVLLLVQRTDSSCFPAPLITILDTRRCEFEPQRLHDRWISSPFIQDRFEQILRALQEAIVRSDIGGVHQPAGLIELHWLALSSAPEILLRNFK